VARQVGWTRDHPPRGGLLLRPRGSADALAHSNRHTFGGTWSATSRSTTIRRSCDANPFDPRRQEWVTSTHQESPLTASAAPQKADDLVLCNGVRPSPGWGDAAHRAAAGPYLVILFRC